MIRTGVASLGALLALLGNQGAQAQLTIAPTAAAKRDAAISAPAGSSPASSNGAQPTASAAAPAPTLDCSLSWAEIEDFARGKTVLKQTPTCFIHAGPNVFKR